MADQPDVTAWAVLLRTHAAVVPKLERALRPSGLPLTWYDVLLVVNSAPDRRLRITELGRQAVVSRERVSRVVTELEREGLMERVPNPDDKRSCFAAITKEGRTRLRAAAPLYLAGIEEHYLRHLSAKERTVIGAALGKLLVVEED